MRSPLLALAALALSGCGTPVYTLVMKPTEDPIVSRSTISPELATSPRKRVLVLHPRWPSETVALRRSAIERGFLARGVQTRFLDPDKAPETFEAAKAMIRADDDVDSVLEISSFLVLSGEVSRYFMWGSKGLGEVDRVAYAASNQPVKVTVTGNSSSVTARLLTSTGELLASQRLSLPFVNYPTPDPYTRTFTLEEGQTRTIKSNEDVIQPVPGNPREELLLEAIGKELPRPGQPRPADPQPERVNDPLLEPPPPKK